jgi:hypothetical protein
LYVKLKMSVNRESLICKVKPEVVNAAAATMEMKALRTATGRGG